MTDRDKFSLTRIQECAFNFGCCRFSFSPFVDRLHISAAIHVTQRSFQTHVLITTYCFSNNPLCCLNAWHIVKLKLQMSDSCARGIDFRNLRPHSSDCVFFPRYSCTPDFARILKPCSYDRDFIFHIHDSLTDLLYQTEYDKLIIIRIRIKSLLLLWQFELHVSIWFSTFRKYAKIAPLLDVEDMVQMPNPDWRCVFTYLQSFYRRFAVAQRQQRSQQQQQPTPDEQPSSPSVNATSPGTDGVRSPEAGVDKWPRFELRP